MEELDVAPGFWRQSAFSGEIRRCHNANACLGGTNTSAQCAEGHRGAYCDVCAEGYFGGRNGLQCEPCKGSSILAYVPLMLALLVLLVLVVFAVRKRGKGAAADTLGNVVMSGLEEGVSGISATLKEDATALAQDMASGMAKEILFPRIQSTDQILYVTLERDPADGLWGIGTVDVDYGDDDIDFNRVQELQPRAASQGLRLRDKIVGVDGATADGKILHVLTGKSVAVLTVARPKLAPDSQKRFARLGRLGNWVEHKSEAAGGFMIKLRILIALWQVLGALGIVFDIPYPDVYTRALDWLASIVQFDLPSIMPLQCIHPIDFHGKLVLRTLLPLMVMGILVGVARAVQNRNMWKVLSDRCYIGCFYVLFLIYPSCSAAIFTFFVCDELPDGSRYLRVDYAIDCDGTAHKGYTAYTLAMFLVYPLGTPLIFYLFLWREQHMLHRISRHEYSASALRQLEKKRTGAKKSGRRRQESATRAPSFPPVAQGRDASPEWHDGEVERLKARLSPFVAKLTEGYEMRCFWFEVFECGRKIFLVGIPALFEPGSVEQFIFGMIICFLSYGMYAYWTPYDDEGSDRLQTAAQVEIFVALLAWAGGELNSGSTAMAVALTGLLCVPPTIALLYQTGLDAEVKKLRECVRRAAARLAPSLAPRSHGHKEEHGHGALQMIRFGGNLSPEDEASAPPDHSTSTHDESNAPVDPPPGPPPSVHYESNAPVKPPPGRPPRACSQPGLKSGGSNISHKSSSKPSIRSDGSSISQRSGASSCGVSVMNEGPAI